MALDLTGIHNVGEFYSHHYLDALLEGDLKQTFKKWRARERDSGKKRPEKRLAGLTERYFRARSHALGEPDVARRLELARDLNDHLLRALGYDPSPGIEPLDDGSVVPVFLSQKRDGQPFLWVLEAPLPEDEDADPFDEVPRPEQLPRSMKADGDPLDQLAARLPDATWRDLLDGPVFRQDHPPRWVLFVNGADAFLIDRHKWGEGRYLHVELGEVFGRRQTKALRATAGLLHREVLNPDDGICLHDTLDENSHKHAFAVSTDLKYGARRAVELLANEAIWYMREVLRTRVMSDDELAGKLTRECLIYLYRLLFLFYVEARGGELGIIPMQSDAYRQGYSLEHLRDLEITPLTTVDARDGFYINNSLERLFEIVNLGFGDLWRRGEGGDPLDEGFALGGLRSPLFDPERTPTLRPVKFRNVVLQEVLRALSLSREKGRKERGRISYAQLGINQLGAVYEGLLAYTGFFANEDLYELRDPKSNDAEDRVFFTPTTDAERFRDNEFARDEHGKRIVHERGTFIFRLAGRDREKSASYYTPEVLTRCLTKYTLKERLKDVSADEILDLTVCEPAMGSGAFLNEAVNQLADAYLERKQAELGETLSSDGYQRERQIVKDHIARHNCYGVDLNPLAAELGKVSLWLNVLHEGARAPYLDLRIAVGNSLIGGRREVFRAGHLKLKSRKKNWLSKVPERVPLGEPRPEDGIYHFLVPDRGMVAFDKDKVVKQLLPKAVDRIRSWRRAICQPFSPIEIEQLLEISKLIDKLWAEHTARRIEVLENVRQPLPIWGQPEPDDTRQRTVEECEYWGQQLDGAHTSGQRLKAAMDYWCALWFWPLEQVDLLPSREHWLADVRGHLVGTRELDASTIERLEVAEEVAKRIRFHHWELAFSEVFALRGGFDVILGNPPWIKVSWSETGVLSDLDPAIYLRRLSAKRVSNLRDEIFSHEGARSSYLGELGELTGMGAYLNATQNYSALKGVQTNLYKCFLSRGVELLDLRGIEGLIHQKGVYDDPRGGLLRRTLAPRLRWHLHFINKLLLFESIKDEKHYEFSVVSGGGRETISFSNVSNLVHPRTLDESLAHNGQGPVPGIKDEDGNWDLRGHRSRVVEVDEESLRLFADLYDEPGTPALEARLPVVHSVEIMGVIRSLANSPTLHSVGWPHFYISEHLHESRRQEDGTIRRQTAWPEEAGELILSGPHFFVATPFYKTPNEDCSHNQDYSPLDLTELPRDYLPRTNYILTTTWEEYLRRIPHWNGRPVTAFFRHVHRQMVAPTGERSYIPAIISRDVGHVDSVFALAFDEDRDLVQFSALSSSIVLDFYVKTTGKGSIRNAELARIPVSDRLRVRLAGRILRLACLTQSYAPLWQSCFDDRMRRDSFVKTPPNEAPWGQLERNWFPSTPVRSPLARRSALVELDALSAMALGITADQLCTIYRVQFPVLYQYEAETFYDQRGKIVFTVNRGLPGVGVKRKEWNEIKNARAGDELPDWACDATGAFVPPFDRCDREADMRQAYAHFEKLLAEESEAEA